MKPLPVGKVWAPSHTEEIFNPRSFKVLVDKTCKAVVKLRRKLKFQCLAATGNSGVLLAGAVSYKLGIPLLIVRKKGDDCHDSLRVNGYRTNGQCRYLIVDDLIASGDTVRRIMKLVDDGHKYDMENRSWDTTIHDNEPPVCAGILLYSSNYNDPELFQDTNVTIYSVGHVATPRAIKTYSDCVAELDKALRKT